MQNMQQILKYFNKLQLATIKNWLAEDTVIAKIRGLHFWRTLYVDGYVLSIGTEQKAQLFHD